MSDDDIKTHSLKNILFGMWYRVETKQFDSRSFVGDTSLQLRDLLFDNAEDFWSWYEACKIIKGIE